MELWHVYLFVRYVKNKTGDSGGINTQIILAGYRDETKYGEYRVRQIMEGAIEKKFIWDTNGVIQLRHDGIELINQIFGIPYGIILAELRLFNPIIVLLSGGLIFELIRWIIGAIINL